MLYLEVPLPFGRKPNVVFGDLITRMNKELWVGKNVLSKADKVVLLKTDL